MSERRHGIKYAMANSPLNGLEVRTADLQDVAVIADLYKQLGYPDASTGLEVRLTRLMGDDFTRVLVALNQSQVIGVLVMHVFHPLHVARPWALISSLVVDETQRAHGAGRALIAQAQAASEKLACAHLELACSARRTSAHAFYESQGFAEIRKRFVKKLM